MSNIKIQKYGNLHIQIKINKEGKEIYDKILVSCMGGSCKRNYYIFGSPEHNENLHFDKQTNAWWCYDCSGYLEITNDENNKDSINIINSTKQVLGQI